VLLVLAHFGVALIATALVIAFRTSMSLPQLFIAASGFLGGVYWPTSVIPSWVRHISDALPISYGLRALRRTMLSGEPLSVVGDDVLTLAGYGGLLLSLGAISVSVALSYARRRGTLAQY
jgi:ABC-2 type transport system permease protein